METSKHHIEPAAGRLGVLTVGLGAVASTVIAGVELIRRGLAEPIGSLTQMGTIRLGQRTEDRVPLIRDFVPLAGLDQLVFGAWDPISDTAYEAALKCGVLDRPVHIEPIAAELKEIEPMPAVFDQDYVRRLDGSNVKSKASKRDLAESVRKDIRDFKAAHSCDRVVVIWCASTETFLEPGPAHQDLDALEAAMDANDQSVPPSMLYAYAALKEGVSFYGEIHHKVSINYYPPRGDSKEGWDNIGIFGWLGYPMQIKVDFLCRDSILAAPLALDLVLFMDLAQRAGLKGVQEWLSFYFKSPQHARGGYPEHDLFIQQAELKSMLRSLMGEEHLGMEYHQD